MTWDSLHGPSELLLFPQAPSLSLRSGKVLGGDEAELIAQRDSYVYLVYQPLQL